MNRYVKEKYKELTPELSAEFFASFLKQMIESDDKSNYVALIKKITQNKVSVGGWIGGEHALKYFMRIFLVDRKIGQNLTRYSSTRDDPYQVSKYSVFSGSFSFDKNLGGFVPVMKTIECTKKRSDWHRAMQQRDILSKWEGVKSFLCSPTGHAASLIYSLEDQHLYFMRNTATEEIKIGISKHPEIRRKQIQSDECESVEILHIINGGGRDLEKYLHDKFKKHNTRGEWFKPAQSLLDYIDGYKETLKVAA